MMKRLISTICFLLMMFAVHTFTAHGQPNNYPATIQGSLKDGSAPANGSYDFLLGFFSVPTGGDSFGTRNFSGIQVTNGTFTITGGFGEIFPSPLMEQWVEFRVRPGGSSVPHTVLTPRQRITYAPLAVSSVTAVTATNALSLNGVDAAQFVQTGDPRMTDARAPLPGSGNYIRNIPVGQTGQSDASFAISGTGRASILEANEFGLPLGTRILAATTNGTNNLQVGVFTGSATNGITNNNNVFVGWSAGRNVTTGSGNTFTGSSAGADNTVGSNNSYFGSLAGRLAFSGNFNSFVGHRSGEFTSGSLNTFMGTGAGSQNGTGSSNSFFGHDSGNTITNGAFNTSIGENADFSVNSLSNSTVVGSKAFVTQSNSLVLGSINGVNGATADTKVGIGTTAPVDRLHVNGTIRVTNGAVYITNPNTVIITSPNGACWGITVNNSGVLATFPIAPCP